MICRFSLLFEMFDDVIKRGRESNWSTSKLAVEEENSLLDNFSKQNNWFDT